MMSHRRISCRLIGRRRWACLSCPAFSFASCCSLSLLLICLLAVEVYLRTLSVCPCVYARCLLCQGCVRRRRWRRRSPIYCRLAVATSSRWLIRLLSDLPSRSARSCRVWCSFQLVLKVILCGRLRIRSAGEADSPCWAG